MSRTQRGATAVTAVLLALVLMSACAPDPTPTPTPTGFASEQEAFAAAEATYRAYVDALNQVDLSDPATFEPVYAHLSGSALSDEKKSLTTMHADGWIVAGESVVVDFYGESAGASIVAVSCLDVAGVTLSDSGGQSVVDASRPVVYALRLTFDAANVDEVVIDSTAAIEDTRCAGS